MLYAQGRMRAHGEDTSPDGAARAHSSVHAVDGGAQGRGLPARDAAPAHCPGHPLPHPYNMPTRP